MKIKTVLQFVILSLIVMSGFIIYKQFFSKEVYVEELVLDDKEIQKKIFDKIDNEDEKDNLILNLEYKSMDAAGNIYLIKSESAESAKENVNLLKLKNVNASVKLINKPTIFIKSDFANHNKETFDTEFYNNVEIKHEDIRVFSENLDLLYNENLVSLYNINEAYNDKTKLTADKINFDILSRDLTVIMYKKDERVEFIKK